MDFSWQIVYIYGVASFERKCHIFASYDFSENVIKKSFFPQAVTCIMFSTGCMISTVGSVRPDFLDLATDFCCYAAARRDAVVLSEPRSPHRWLGCFKVSASSRLSVQTRSCRPEHVFSGRETRDVCSFMEWCESVWSWKEDRQHKGGAAAGHLVAITHRLKSHDPLHIHTFHFHTILALLSSIYLFLFDTFLGVYF